VITDRELDAQLAGAAGVRDADLPALPEDFLGLLTAGAGNEPASVIAARQLVSDAQDSRTTRRRRRRVPARKTTLRLGAALIAVAAAWTTAVLVTPSDGTPTPDVVATPTPGIESPAGGITLVAAEEVTFPLSLDPVPVGLTPVFSRFGGVAHYGDQPLVFTADYGSANGDRVLVSLFAEDPRGLAEFGWSVEGDATGTVTVDGTEAEVRSAGSSVDLLWERADGRWVRILGEGAFARTAAVVAVGESLADRPQPVGLQFGLAPAGWSPAGYEESRSLDLVSDVDPEQLLRVSLIGREGGATVDSVLGGMPMAGPVTPVTVQGQEGRMALADGGSDPDFWQVVGQLPDGPLFLLLAPDALTQEQVLAIAEQVTYTP
jgi:hypothetical protein